MQRNKLAKILVALGVLAAGAFAAQQASASCGTVGQNCTQQVPWGFQGYACGANVFASGGLLSINLQDPNFNCSEALGLKQPGQPNGCYVVDYTADGTSAAQNCPATSGTVWVSGLFN
jgi:hypothetical protein